MAQCEICYEEDDLVTLKCKHAFCETCLQGHFKVKLESKAAQLLCEDSTCPGEKCSEVITRAFLLKHSSDETKERIKLLYGTIPLTPIPKSLDEFNYHYNKDGFLRHKTTGEKFMFVSQRHYDALGDLVVEHIQQRLVKDFGLQEVWIPAERLGDKDNGRRPKARSNIFMSPDALENKEKLLILIQGSGAVRPGMWARALCINDSLELGTIFPYLKQAKEEGYGVIVLNPNFNYVFQSSAVSSSTPTPDREASLKYYLADFKTVKRELKIKEQDEKKVIIPGSEDPRNHTLYVWDNFISKSQAKHLVIVAHSAGGAGTMFLLKKRGDEVLKRLRAIAFTDSVHSVLDEDPPKVKSFIIQNAINWVTSEKPLNTVIKRTGLLAGKDGCQCLSAGHEKHEYTSGCAFPAIFPFFQKKLEAFSTTTTTTTTTTPTTTTPTKKKKSSSGKKSKGKKKKSSSKKKKTKDEEEEDDEEEMES